jgi:hypothetical protein
VNNNYNSNTVVRQDFPVVNQVDGRAAHMTDITRHQSWQSTPPPYQGLSQNWYFTRPLNECRKHEHAPPIRENFEIKSPESLEMHSIFASCCETSLITFFLLGQFQFYSFDAYCNLAANSAIIAKFEFYHTKYFAKP